MAERKQPVKSRLPLLVFGCLGAVLLTVVLTFAVMGGVASLFKKDAPARISSGRIECKIPIRGPLTGKPACRYRIEWRESYDGGGSNVWIRYRYAPGSTYLHDGRRLLITGEGFIVRRPIPAVGYYRDPVLEWRRQMPRLRTLPRALFGIDRRLDDSLRVISSTKSQLANQPGRSWLWDRLKGFRLEERVLPSGSKVRISGKADGSRFRLAPGGA